MVRVILGSKPDYEVTSRFLTINAPQLGRIHYEAIRSGKYPNWNLICSPYRDIISSDGAYITDKVFHSKAYEIVSPSQSDATSSLYADYFTKRVAHQDSVEHDRLVLKAQNINGPK